MSTYLYIKKTINDVPSVVEQIQLVNEYQVDQVFIEEDHSSKELDTLMKQLVDNDTFIIYSLSIVELSNHKMRDFFQVMKTHSIHLISIKDKIDTNKVESTDFIANCLIFLNAQAQLEKQIKKDNVSDPKEIGRPKISATTIQRIIFLRENEKRSIRSIAHECDVSIGTVHKYVTSK